MWTWNLQKCDGVGVLSKNAVTNMKYHFVITTTMITRLYHKQMEWRWNRHFTWVILYSKAGWHSYGRRGSEPSWWDGDSYTEKCADISETTLILNTHINASKGKVEGKEYIYSHIKERITIERSCRFTWSICRVISDYLKTGISVSAYIRRQKIEMAEKSFWYSDSMVRLQMRLSFSSQSFHPTV